MKARMCIRRVGEFLLDELQSRSGAEDARELGKASECLPERGRAGRGKSIDRLSQGSSGRDGCDDIAQTVGPCRLYFAHAEPTATREVTAGKQRNRDRWDQRNEERAGERDEYQEGEQAGGRASRPEPRRSQTGPGLLKPEA